MSRELRSFSAIFSRVLGLALLLTVRAPAQQQSSGPIVIHESEHDVSPTLRDIVARMPAPGARAPAHVIPLRHPHLIDAQQPSAADSALQNTAAPPASTINPSNFDGITANGYAPPDANGSVGDTQFVQIVNVEYAVYDKASGAVLLGPVPINTIWSGFGGLCETTNGGDPIVLYDKIADRWLISQLAYTPRLTSNFQCIAVSTTPDATGAYNRYAYDFGGNLPDYPKFGVWPDAYYGSSNTFSGSTGAFLGARACAYDRTSMLAGTSAAAICFQQGTKVASLLPSDVDGSTPPPAGEPDFFLGLSGNGGSALWLFKFHADFLSPSNSTFTGPQSINVASFTTCGTCVFQGGAPQQLDSLDDRLMNRLAYRNFADHEALVVNHSVVVSNGAGVNWYGLRWYEIRSPNGKPSLYQQGTYAPDSTFRWMGSAAMDRFGDLALGYSASSPTTYPSVGVRYAGRVPSDPLGTLEAESTLLTGNGVQVYLSRWGDYTSLSVDPGDDCTFWYTNEYLDTIGDFNWKTRIGSFRFPACDPPPDFTLAAVPASQSVIAGGGTTYTVTVTALNGFTGTTNFSVSGLPSGATASFSPSSVMSSGSSTMTVNTSGATPGGGYTLTITGTSGALVRTASVALAVGCSGCGDFSMGAWPGILTVHNLRRDRSRDEWIYGQRHIQRERPAGRHRQFLLSTIGHRLRVFGPDCDHDEIGAARGISIYHYRHKRQPVSHSVSDLDD